ncbi:MAG: hypothetical protein QOK30_3513 [Nocardioidaceae bacterium]|nr:hypothetical protein [Nocardioidaceae bacterium]
MWTLVIAMLVILVLAGLVVLYVAFPHRGEDVPAAPWLGDALRKGVEAAPTLENSAPGDTTEPEQGAGSLGFTFTESGPTGPSHRGG